MWKVHNSCFMLMFFVALLMILALPDGRAAATEQDTAQENKYVGIEACAECHQDVVDKFRQVSGKANTHKKAISLLQRKLTPQELEGCFACHSTGYGEASGFVSYEKTPHLANVGCEACHGMGYAHTMQGSKESIQRKPSMKTCLRCHDPAVITPIKFNNSMYSGGH